MRKNKFQNIFKVLLTVTFLVSSIQNPGKASIVSPIPLISQKLATQSIFDPITNTEAFKLKDLAIAESLVLGHLKMNDSFLFSKGVIEENVSEQTRVRYDFNNLQKIQYEDQPTGYMLPLKIEYFDIATKKSSSLREYYVYISPDSKSITPFTKEERERIINTDISFIHSERKEVEEIRSIIEHELWTDTPLMQLAPTDIFAFGAMDINIQTVSNFLKAVGAEMLSNDFLLLVNEGRVFKVNREAEVDIPGYGIIKVSDERIKVDHASNIGIYVKERTLDEKQSFQLALIHEVLARAGVSADINDNFHILNLVEQAFTSFIKNDNSFEIKKKKLEYAISRAFEDEKIDQSIEKLSFKNVNLNIMQNRDLSFPSDRKRRLIMAKKAIRDWKVNTKSKEHWDIHPNDSLAVSYLQKEALALYNEYKLFELSVGEILEFVNEVFDGNSYSIVNNTVHHIIFDLSDFDMKSRPHELTPSNFHEVSRELASLKVEGSFSDVNNINFVFHRLVFDFFRTERSIAELSWIAQEIQRERDFPGAGRLPVICAMQDLHGAATRAMAMVGYAAGLKANVLNELISVTDPTKILEKIKRSFKECWNQFEIARFEIYWYE